MITRRTFLRWALPAAATAIVAPQTLLEAALDPDRLTWVPGRKTTFDLHIPGQRLAYPETLCSEAFRLLAAQLKFAENINRDYSRDFTNHLDDAVGYTVRARLPQRYDQQALLQEKLAWEREKITHEMHLAAIRRAEAHYREARRIEAETVIRRVQAGEVYYLDGGSDYNIRVSQPPDGTIVFDKVGKP
jgi:hypothetical protein